MKILTIRENQIRQTLYDACRLRGPMSRTRELIKISGHAWETSMLLNESSGVQYEGTGTDELSPSVS